MGFFPDLKEIRSSLATPEKWLVDWFQGGAETNAGVRVDEGTAVNFSAVFNAITILSGVVMQLPFQLFKRISDNDRERAIGHPAEKFGSLKVNPKMTASRFRQTAQHHLLTWGNFYAQKIYDRGGRIIELYPLRPDKMKVERRNGKTIYEYTKTDGTPYILKDWEILHLPGLGFDGIMGYSIVTLARESIGLGMAMEEYQSRFYGQGTHPGIILKHPGKMKEGTKEQLKKDMTDKYSGLGKTHKVMVIEDGMEIEQLDMKLTDAEFLASKKFTVDEIARWFNMPPHMLKNMDRATFSNIEHQSIEFVQYTMGPWFTLWEDEFSSQILGDDWGEYYFEYIVDALLRGDTTARYEAYNKAILSGIMTPNEARRRENLPTHKNGDILLVPLNMIPIEKAGNIEAKQTTRTLNPIIKDIAGRMSRLLEDEIKARQKKGNEHSEIVESIFDERGEYLKKLLTPLFETKQKFDENDIIKTLAEIKKMVLSENKNIGTEIERLITQEVENE